LIGLIGLGAKLCEVFIRHLPFFGFARCDVLRTDDMNGVEGQVNELRPVLVPPHEVDGGVCKDVGEYCPLRSTASVPRRMSFAP
jgi:hypothetical protein